jgi:hypothetical protein
MADKSSLYRSAKDKAFKQVLKPAGFVKGRYLFARKAHGQLHGIDFQTSKWGGEYFLNVAFHYDFLPPLVALANNTIYAFERFGVTDFLLHTRLEALMQAGYPKEWSYGEEVKDLEKQVKHNARDTITALDELGEKWREPTVFLALLPPQLLEEDYRKRLARTAPPLPYDQALGPGWPPPAYFKLGYCLCVIAMRARRIDLAKAYLKVAEIERMGRGEKALADLHRELEKSASNRLP